MSGVRRRGAATALLAVALLVNGLATGCTDDEPAPEDEALTGLLDDLADDPAAARAFLLADDTPSTAEVAEDSGLPEQGRVTALLTDDALRGGAAADDLAATLTAGMSEAGGSDARGRARVVREVLLAWKGGPVFDDDVRAAAADVVAAGMDPSYADLARAADRETWPESATRSFLVDAGRDPAARRALHRALLSGLRQRLPRMPADELARATDDIGVPAGRLLGALDSDTGDADLLAEDRDALEALLRRWLRRNGADEVEVVNFAGDVGQAFAEEQG